MFRRCAALFFAHCLAAQVGADPVLKGIATVIDGDTLALHGTEIRLHGIDAPESTQICLHRTGKQWPCGRRAEQALHDLLAQKTIRCDAKDTDKYGRVVATCHLGTTVVNEWLVANGWAVAYRRYSRAYAAAERAAQAAQLHIWSGTFTMPEEYRHGSPPAAAPRQTPASTRCAIKGNISGGGRIYHVPGSRSYEDTRIDTAAGERWFCSEAEAQAAGWRKAGS